ncbi:MAG TPA: hypothetical protein VE954_14470 [Oligoflexus sp.]|uniref:hypothetical protein n=1 Tax=Oligoflexus sp. TaxID=1971216 RepID=UPI002D58E896|nr:hypothetical protein [Oligoflexus sp.]HYX34304.1 hypothetical protein [Oligoflexus sp.]
MSCTIRGSVIMPSGYLVDLNIDSVKVLGSGVLANADTIDYLVKVETVSPIQYVYRYQKTIIGPKNGAFESTLDTMTPTIADIPCPKDAVSVPFNIVIQSTLRASTATTLAEVEGFLNRAPGFTFRYRTCKQ